MTIVMLAGGIDLSVGSNFALANVTALALINVAKWPVAAAIAATIAIGALVGLVNGLLIGYLRLRAFLTTLVMLTLIRAIVEILLQNFRCRIASSDVESDALGLYRHGSVLGVPFSSSSSAQSRSSRKSFSPGFASAGASRPSADRDARPTMPGIPVRATVCMTYVISGLLTGLAGTLYAARLSGAGPDTGVGLELAVVTAAMLGGNSVGGGRGSVGKALMGAFIVFAPDNGLVRLGLENGASSLVMGLVLLLAIAIDVSWSRWRQGCAPKSTYRRLISLCPRLRTSHASSSSPYAMNDRLQRRRDDRPRRNRRSRGRHSR